SGTPVQALPSYERSRNDVPGNEASAFESSKNPDARGTCVCGHDGSSMDILARSAGERFRKAS
ncbi:MAG: hypothetical protein WBN30_02535, partial [Polyangiales bacterium]